MNLIASFWGLYSMNAVNTWYSLGYHVKKNIPYLTKNRIKILPFFQGYDGDRKEDADGSRGDVWQVRIFYSELNHTSPLGIALFIQEMHPCDRFQILNAEP